jgi:thiosulfate/3-mercaptopyruvate sulfurtransferase
MKNNRTYLFILLASILVIVIIIGNGLFAKYQKPGYQLTTAELLMEMGNSDRLISVDNAQKILAEKDVNYRFVDVRNSIDFGNGHIEGAINIPYHRLLQPSYLRKLKSETAELILYGASLTQANSAWMILRQKEVSSIKILQGAFEAPSNELLVVEEVDIPEITLEFEAVSYGDVITAADFMALYNSNENLIIIDVNKSGTYNSSHIQNAINVFHADLYQKGDIPNIMMTPDEMASYLGEKGVKENSQIVVYDDGSQMYAARLYFILKYLGAADVKMLPNVSNQWKNAGIPMSSDPSELPATTFTPIVDQGIYASTDYVDAQKAKSEVAVLDLRTPMEYNGTLRSKGHIPGAINISHSNLLTRSGAFKSKGELEAIARELGISPEQEIIFSCRTGIKASLGFTAFKNILEYENIKLYDGSYVEWAAAGKAIEN